ncbi:histidine phosphatase family protein [Pontibacillus marinus]|uniref:Phosphoglycerate mutase n=1 Tax=Pontibacillus marinus BH030004 = DSM 16465 TaxID=1385511 RepID=A0A0A5HHR5_9BACI|nr:histidine phosphatase family protein [Pontibacillus marinus]KGX83202.1 phosphoglycerate mutase [Pontibacillus marinus BH030004 = DSM 16465]
MLTLYITRHGETVWNTQKRMQGWSDSELTDNGVKDAVSLGKRIKDVDFVSIYSSPSNRTQMTASLIQGNRDIPILLDDNLREINMGDWEGNTISFIENMYPEEYYSFWNTPHLYRSHKGESFYDLRHRVMKFLCNIQEKYTSGNILIVTHAVVIKTLLAFFKNYPLERLWEPPFIHGTSLTKIELNEGEYNIAMEGDFLHECKEREMLNND